MHELAPIITALAQHKPRRHRWRHRLSRAAVAVVLRESTQGTQVLLVERAQRPGDPWSGDMAFPGGRVDVSDEASASRAARRECFEEVGLTINRLHDIGRLSDLLSPDHRRRRLMVISPFVYRWPEHGTLQTNDEIAGIEWVTLGWLAEHAHRQRLAWQVGPVTLSMPSYALEGQRRLWGLTLRMLDELIALAERD